MSESQKKQLNSQGLQSIRWQTEAEWSKLVAQLGLLKAELAKTHISPSTLFKKHAALLTCFKISQVKVKSPQGKPPHLGPEHGNKKRFKLHM